MEPETRASRAVYVISVAAELAGVHPQTLRIYERKGLLDPARTVGGSRRYSEADIAQLRRIQQLTNAGINLEGVRRVMELEAEVAQLRAELESVRRAAVAEMDRIRRQAAEEVDRTHRQYRRDLVPVRNLPDIYMSAPKNPQRRNHGA
ncbi:MAG TPA: MerR family transcriptional regulator [Acidimicrobiales bacterium]|nr:MerR family transcriptional regulator [Acidimicrobiales bacterium]